MSKPSTFRGKSVEWGSESLKLSTALDPQATYFYILALYINM